MNKTRRPGTHAGPADSHIRAGLPVHRPNVIKLNHAPDIAHRKTRNADPGAPETTMEGPFDGFDFP